MKKFLVAYPVWNKADMVPWLMQGIAENILPSEADVYFRFTGCTDGSLAAFVESRHGLNGFSYFMDVDHRTDRWELDQHNDILLKYDGEYKAIIIPQDDNRIIGKTLLSDLDHILKVYGETLGLIGGRDGYSFNHTAMVGSPHSLSVNKQRTLAIGDHAQAHMLNTGPLVYRHGLVERVGLHNEEQKIYAMDDYSLRCQFIHGLKNVVLGMDIDHRKFGNYSQTTFLPNMAANDLHALNTHWQPILGHNVH